VSLLRFHEASASHGLAPPAKRSFCMRGARSLSVSVGRDDPSLHGSRMTRPRLPGFTVEAPHGNHSTSRSPSFPLGLSMPTRLMPKRLLISRPFGPISARVPMCSGNLKQSNSTENSTKLPDSMTSFFDNGRKRRELWLLDIDVFSAKPRLNFASRSSTASKNPSPCGTPKYIQSPCMIFVSAPGSFSKVPFARLIKSTVTPRSFPKQRSLSGIPMRC